MQQAAHNLTDAQPSAPADKTAFDFALPMHVFEKADAPEGQKRRFGGICSTDNIDRQGERILQDGLDWDDFFEHGWFNDNHSQKTADVLGYGDKDSLLQFKTGDMLPNGSLATSNGTWVEGYLLNRPACDQIWDLAQSLQGTGRNLGFSVEGNIVKRTGLGNKTIAKAKIRNIALTNCPVNTDAKLEILARSLAAAEAQAQREDAEKAMGGAGAPVPLANAEGTGMTAGRIVAKEALEADLHNNAGGEILRRKGKKKKRKVALLTRSQAIAYVQRRAPGLSKNAAEQVLAMNKAGAGEGSRGGKIIGHTKSGKPVYSRKQAIAYGKDFNSSDHEDAANLHATRAKHHEKLSEDAASSLDLNDNRFERHGNWADHHEFMSEHHLQQAGEKSAAGRRSVQKSAQNCNASSSLNIMQSLDRSAALAYLQARIQGLSKADAHRLLCHSKALQTAGLI